MPVPERQILICTNDRDPGGARPCCGARDGIAVYREFKDEVRRRGLRKTVLVTRTGCLRHCSLGVTVVAWPDNAWFGSVTRADVAALLTVLLHNEAHDGRLTDEATLETARSLAIPAATPWE